jgi:transcriptional regulator with XRE-family HTH domain
LDDSKDVVAPDRRMFGEQIRAARHAAGMSQAVLARAAKISPVYVSQIEAGLRIPSDRNARLLAEALGLPWQDLLRAAYSLRSSEAGELFGTDADRSDPQWKSISDIPAVRQLLVELAGLNLSKKDVEILARNWGSDLRFITGLTKAQTD